MKLMCSSHRLLKLTFALLLTVSVAASGGYAQSKKKAAAKAPTKKTEKQARDARKGNSNSKATARNTKKDTKKTKSATTAKASPKKNSKESKRETAERKKADRLSTAERRKAEAARRREAEERRQAAIAEQRRREQAAREARARRIAFERGLRTETVENIANDITDGEDLQVRRAAVSALGNHAGTVVVMEAKTGKLLTVVNQDWAIKEGFKPCSTIKLVTGVAGLNEQVINGDDGLDYALAKSKNGYFQRVGSKVGNTKMIDYAKKLGLGTQTGINAEGETAGKLPYGNNNARIYSHGDDFEVTPLQLAVMVSALSNGGHKVVPRFSKPTNEKAVFAPRSTSDLGLSKTSFEGVLPGMVGAAEYGTAHRGVDASMGVAGKTGSCIGRGSWVGLFASVAPVEDPKYSVVVITRGQSERGKYAAAIAGQIYNTLRPRINRNPESLWAKRTMKPATADQQTAAEEDEEEADEIAATEEHEVPAAVDTRSRQVAVQPVPKKLVQKTSQSKPVHPQVVITYDRSGAETSAPKGGVELTRPRVVKN